MSQVQIGFGARASKPKGNGIVVDLHQKVICFS
jgi:hypothetical protein